jgi:serine/threonine protein kinase
MVADMPAPGEIFGHYRVEEKLGEGAFGVVFRGEDLRLHRKVALKIPRRCGNEDAEAWGRLLREARAASALNHPNICAIYDIGEVDDRNFIALEYVEGRALSDVIRDGLLPAPTALTYAGQMAAALAHAHSRGIIHRDLKAANVVITSEGQAKLLDFGLARRLDSQTIEALSQSRQSLADIGHAAGTLCYMAPEVLRGKPATVRSDLWSLGALLHESLCGKLPFQAETPFELSLAIMLEEPKALSPEVPAAARAVVAKCLQKEPTKRYENAEELLEALEKARAALHAKRARWVRRWFGLAGVLLVLTAGLGLSGDAVTSPPFGPTQPASRWFGHRRLPRSRCRVTTLRTLLPPNGQRSTANIRELPASKSGSHQKVNLSLHRASGSQLRQLESNVADRGREERLSRVGNKPCE